MEPVIRLVALEPRPLHLFCPVFFLFFSFFFLHSRPVPENLVFVIFICHGRCDSPPDDPDSLYPDDFKRCNIDKKERKKKERKKKKKNYGEIPVK